MTALGRRLRRWIRQLIRREKAWTPVSNSHLVYDPAFVAASMRPGQRFDPLSATIEEFDA